MTTSNHRFIVIIPARYASSRFPGKPLARIGDTEMIVHVCRQAAKACSEVVVATDDQRIADCVDKAGFRAIMTSPDHHSGTDRVREAFIKSGSDADVIINIQGDEPFIHPDQIHQLMRLFDDSDTEIGTLARRFDPALGFEALFDPNLVKVTFADNGNALYFSRSIIPYVRTAEWKEWLSKATFHTHVGVYAYRADVLKAITDLPESSLELTEKLEQLRWLQNGRCIRVAVTPHPTIGIDTPADLEAARRYWESLKSEE